MSSLDESSQDPADPTDLHIFSEQQQHVLRLLRGLPPGQRTIAALFYDGMACGEIADVLNRTSATVRSQLRNARETLKEMTSCQDPDSAALDNYVRTQLTRAAESYAAQTDSETKLKAIMEPGQNDRHDDAAAADT